MAKRRRGYAPAVSRGFSLIEVLVAFTILALMLGGLFEVFSQGLRSAGQGQDFTRAVMLAHSKLAEIGAESGLPEGVSVGKFDDLYRWRSEVVPFTEVPIASESGIQALSARVEVFWSDGWRERSVDLTTLHLVTK